MCNMQAGSQMIKLRGKSKALVRLFYLDEHKSCIRWRPSRKHERAKSESDRKLFELLGYMMSACACYFEHLH